MIVTHLYSLVTITVVEFLRVEGDIIRGCEAMRKAVRCESDSWRSLQCWYPSDLDICTRHPRMLAHHHLLISQQSSKLNTVFVTSDASFLHCDPSPLLIDFSCEECNFTTTFDNYATVKPSVNLGTTRPRKRSLELNILRDYGLVCHLEEFKVPLDYHVTISGFSGVNQTVFYNQTSMKDRVILEGLTPYQSYNISLRASPSLDLGKTPSLFSNLLITQASTLKDVPDPPTSYKGGYEVISSLNLRLHWSPYNTEKIHGENLTFVVKSGFTGPEYVTENHYLDLLNVTNPGVGVTMYRVFARNEIGLSGESDPIIFASSMLDLPDTIPKLEEALILDSDNGSNVVWRMPNLTSNKIFQSGVEDLASIPGRTTNSPYAGPLLECAGSMTLTCQDTSVTVSWCHHARTRACEDGLEWRTIEVGDPQGGLREFHVPGSSHPDYAFLSLMLNAVPSGLQIIKNRVNILKPHLSSVEALMFTLTSINFKLKIGSIIQVNLLLDNWSVTLCPLSNKTARCLTSNSTSDHVTVSSLSPGSCYSVSHQTFLHWNVNVKEGAEQIFCTLPAPPQNISAVQLPSGSVVVTIGDLPYSDAERGHLNLTCELRLDTDLISASPCSEVLTVTRPPASRGHCRDVTLRVTLTEGDQSSWSPPARLLTSPQPPILTSVNTISGSSRSVSLELTGEDSDHCEVSVEEDGIGEAGFTSYPGVECQGQTSKGCCSMSRNVATLDLALSHPASCTKYSLKTRCSNYVTIDDLQEANQHEDIHFLQHQRHHGKIDLISEWSEVLAYNISCQDIASSDVGLKAGIISSVVLGTVVICAAVFILVKYILRVRSRFRDVSDYQPPITIPMSRFPEESSVFFRCKPSQMDNGLELPDNHIRRTPVVTSTSQETETSELLAPESGDYLDRRTISESSAQSGYIQLPSRPGARTRTTTTGTTSSGYTMISDLPE